MKTLTDKRLKPGCCFFGLPLVENKEVKPHSCTQGKMICLRQTHSIEIKQGKSFRWFHFPSLGEKCMKGYTCEVNM